MSLFSTVVRASAQVAAVRGKLAKRDRLVELLRALDVAERRPAIAWLSGILLQGKVGVGYAEVAQADAAPASAESLSIEDVDRALSELAGISGRGATAARRVRLGELFGRATAEEQDFLRRVMLGELRQGGLDGIMIEAVAVAAEVPVDKLRRAVMLAADLPSVGALALESPTAIDTIEPTLLRPIAPMLASPSSSLAEALAELAQSGTALVEWKLDGARVQVHRDGDEVRVFTRALLDVTGSVPEVVEVARALPWRRFILDGETIALGDEGRPLPFQETQSRFARRIDVESARQARPLSVFFFDALYLEEPILDRPLVERRAALLSGLPAEQRLPSLETSEAPVAQAFFEDALRRGHEGVMVKSLAAPYAAGARGAAWQKVKRLYTLDLVVLAAEWGSGRRRGWLSNLHLGARDPAGGYVMLGKTFKGMTDEVLKWQTEQLLAREVSRDRHVVYVRPELVAEFAFDSVQKSPIYTGGYALRFARLIRYREDKPVEQADTIDQVKAIFEQGRGVGDEGG